MLLFNKVMRRVRKVYYWLRVRLELKTEEHVCPVCGSEHTHKLGYRERFGFPIKFVSCASCGLVMQERIPTQHFTDRFYAKDYYRGLYWGSHVAPQGDYEKREKRAAVRAAYLRSDVTLPSAPTIIDYGAGVGTLKNALLKHWPYAHVYEVDPGTMEQVLPSGVRANLITLMHVLEHMHNPRETLEELKGLLATGGEVYIEVPDLSVLREDRDFHVAHLWYFSVETLTKLAEQVGFTVRKVRREPEAHACAVLLGL